MKVLKKVSAILLGLVVLYSCGSNNSKTNSSEDSCTTSCACGDGCSCGHDPCGCHMKEAKISSTSNDTIAYFNNGVYNYVELSHDVEKAKLFDDQKKLIAEGRLDNIKTTNNILVYNLSDSSIIRVFLKEPKMEYAKGEITEDFILISPSQEVYKSGKDTITAIYRPSESVTLITQDGSYELRQIDSYAKGAEYSDGNIKWIAHMDKGIFVKNGKKTEFHKEGKSTLPTISHTK